METGKTSKYLKYAIGEILLVVIGILIALQINTWSQIKKERQTETQFLRGLLSDIDAQKLILEEQILEETIRFDNARKAIQTVRNDSLELKADEVFELMNKLTPRKTFSIFNPTYEELKSTGSLKLIKNVGLKKKIVLFYQNLERNGQIIASNNLGIDQFYNPYFHNNTLGFYNNKEGNLMIHWQHKASQLLQLENVLKNRRTHCGVNRKLSNESLVELEELKKEISTYLDYK